MFLIDTNVISELRRGMNASAAVRNWEERTDLTDCYLSPVTISEMEYGWRRLFALDPERATLLRNWMDSVLEKFTGRIIPIDEAVGRVCGRLRLPPTKPQNDLWIAATALAHDLTVVTRNTADFAGTGTKLLNPWLDPIE